MGGLGALKGFTPAKDEGARPGVTNGLVMLLLLLRLLLLLLMVRGELEVMEVEFRGETPNPGVPCLVPTRLSRFTRFEFSPKKAAGDFDFFSLLLSGTDELSPLRSKASDKPLLAGLSLVDRAENSSTSPLFVGEMGAKGSLAGGLVGTGSQGSLASAELEGAGELELSTAQGSLPQIPPMGGSGDLAGG